MLESLHALANGVNKMSHQQAAIDAANSWIETVTEMSAQMARISGELMVAMRLKDEQEIARHTKRHDIALESFIQMLVATEHAFIQTAMVYGGVFIPTFTRVYIDGQGNIMGGADAETTKH